MTEANGDLLTWTYDAVNRLTREQRSGANAYDLTYTYDAVGNRATKLTGGVTTTYTYDAADELTLEDAAGALTTSTYDANGNTLSRNVAGSITTMTWGYEDELTVVQTPAGARVTMTYDGTHMRRQREEGASTAKFLWDGAQILMETDGSDATVARYTLAPFGYGDLLSQRRSGASSFYHFDAIGSTRALTAADQSTTDTYLYEAFGTLKTSTGSATNPYRYVGELGYLLESALDGYLLRRRYYTPRVATFLARDPVGGGAYAYGLNSPVRFADPAGLQEWTPGQGCGGNLDSARNAVLRACDLFLLKKGRQCAYECDPSTHLINCMINWCKSPKYDCVSDPNDQWCCPPTTRHVCGYAWPVENPTGKMRFCQDSFAPEDPQDPGGENICNVLDERIKTVYHEVAHVCGVPGTDEARADRVMECLKKCLDDPFNWL